MRDAPTILRSLNFALAFALASALIGLALYAMFARLGYPYELEWMTGSMLDHVERVRLGLPLYTAPTLDWTPFLYTPLWYWVAAKVTSIVPGYLGCRLLSIVCLFVQTYCVVRLSRSHGASRAWSFLGIGLFYGGFIVTEGWYDLERTDSLFVAILAVAAVVLTESRAKLGAALGGALLGLSFFAKQPGLLFLVVVPFGLVLRRELSRAAIVAASGLAILVPGFLWQNAISDGWFAYYTMKIPGAHGMLLSRASIFFVEDLRRLWLFALASAALVFTCLRRFRHLQDRPDDAVLVAFVVASFGASASSRLHFGGWSNVLWFWIVFGSVAVAIVGTRAMASFPSCSWLPSLAVVMQGSTLLYNPTSRIPTRASVAQGDAVAAVVARLEKDGEVLATGRGHLTRARHAHMAAIADIIGVDRRFLEPIVQPIRDRRFSAIIVDGFEDWAAPGTGAADALGAKQTFFGEIAAGYAVTERLDPALPFPVVGFASRPSWVLVRRPARLDLPRAELARIQAAEIAKLTE